MPGMASLTISPLKVERTDSAVILSASITTPAGVRPLRFEIDARFADLVDTESLDAFVLGLTVPAMRLGLDIVAEGPISPRLLFNLKTQIIPMLETTLPRVRRVDVRAAGATAPPAAKPTGVATGLSGGIDSFTVIAEHYDKCEVGAPRVTHAVFYNTGSHGRGADGRRNFLQRLERIARLADELRLPLVSVDSDLDDFYDGFMFQETHTIRNTATTLALQRGVGQYLYASTYHFRDCHFGPAYDMAYADPALLPMFGTERLEAHSVGSRHARPDKTRVIADLEIARSHLDVCMSGTGHNCSRCAKCMRTQVSLEILGRLDAFGRVFDLARYRRYRTQFIARALSSGNPLEREVVRLAREEGFPIPLAAKILGHSRLIWIPVQARRMLIRLRRGREN